MEFLCDRKTKQSYMSYSYLKPDLYLDIHQRVGVLTAWSEKLIPIYETARRHVANNLILFS